MKILLNTVKNIIIILSTTEYKLGGYLNVNNFFCR